MTFEQFNTNVAAQSRPDVHAAFFAYAYDMNDKSRSTFAAIDPQILRMLSAICDQ